MTYRWRAALAERGSVGLMERELMLNDAVVTWGIDVVGVGNGARGGGLIESILGTTKGGEGKYRKKGGRG